MNDRHFTKVFLSKFQVFLGILALAGLYSSPCAAEPNNLIVLHDFSSTNISVPNSPSPLAGLIQGSDGKFYGSTESGGNANGGTIYRLDTSGVTPNLTKLYSFPLNTLGDYQQPSSLIQGSDGNFYGTTFYGGNFGSGSIFKLNISGTTPRFTILHSLRYTDGANPLSLIKGSDNKFYGISSTGGAFGDYGGVIFRLDTSGSKPVYTVLHSFNGIGAGSNPVGLMQGSNGKLYGTTGGGGTGGGSIFELDITQVTPIYTTLHNFTQEDGIFPLSGLIEGNNGKFYGTASNGGSPDNLNTYGDNTFGYGTVYQLEISGTFPTYTVLHAFYGTNGAFPSAPLVQGNDGRLYGTTTFGGTFNMGTVFRIDTTDSIPSLSIVHSFDGNTGEQPLEAGLIKGSDGFLYGTSYYGGHLGGGGTLYRVTPALTNTTTTTLSSNLNPADFGQALTFTATVVGNSPTGAVAFLEGSNIIGFGSLNAGVATYTSTTLSKGSHGIRANFSGDANDDGSTSSTLTQVVNTPPVAHNDSYSLVHIGINPVTVTAPGLLGNDSDAEGNPLAVAGATPTTITLTTGGTVTLYADGHFVYSPSGIAFAGTRKFTYQATDDRATSNPATVTLTILPAPNAIKDTATTAQSQAVTVNILANDKANGGTINSASVAVVTQPANGSTLVNANGSIVYTPNPNFGGTDTFTYTVMNSLGATSNVATVTVYVPEAVADNYTVTATTGASQKISKNISLGVLANDHPIGVTNRTVSIASGVTRISGTGTATIGALTLTTNGSFNFTLTAPASATTTALKQISKRGKYRFSYMETLNGVTTAPSTATIVVQ